MKGVEMQWEEPKNIMKGNERQKMNQNTTSGIKTWWKSRT